MEEKLPAVLLLVQYLKVNKGRALESITLAIPELVDEECIDYLVSLVVRLKENRSAKYYPDREEKE